MPSLDYDFVSEIILTVLLGGAALAIAFCGLQVRRHQRLSGLYLYPVKSAAAVAVSSATATEHGLAGDRRFQVSETAGDAPACTPRDKKYVKLFQLQPKLTYGEDEINKNHKPIFKLTLTSPEMTEPLEVDLKPSGIRSKTAKSTKVTPVCGPKIRVETFGADVNAWLAQALGVPEQSIALTGMGKDYHRTVLVNPDQKEALPTSTTSPLVSLADEAPYLITSTESLKDLNRRLRARGQPVVPMDRFRPNFVVDNFPPWMEDTWKRIRIGDEAEFFVWQRCGRCSMTTIDRQSLQRGPEPLATLSTFRERAAGQRNFGMHLIPVPGTYPATIDLGDKVHVLEYDAERLEEWKRLFGPKE